MVESIFSSDMRKPVTKTINCGSKAEIAQVVSTVEKSVRVRRANINILPNISRGPFLVLVFGIFGIDFAPIKRYHQFCSRAYRMFKIILECSRSF